MLNTEILFSKFLQNVFKAQDIFLEKICYNNDLHNSITFETDLDTQKYSISIFKVQYFLKHFRHHELFDLYFRVQYFPKRLRHIELLLT